MELVVGGGGLRGLMCPYFFLMVIVHYTELHIAILAYSKPLPIELWPLRPLSNPLQTLLVNNYHDHTKGYGVIAIQCRSCK